MHPASVPAPGRVDKRSAAHHEGPGLVGCAALVHPSMKAHRSSSGLSRFFTKMASSLGTVWGPTGVDLISIYAGSSSPPPAFTIASPSRVPGRCDGEGGRGNPPAEPELSPASVRAVAFSD